MACSPGHSTRNTRSSPRMPAARGVGGALPHSPRLRSGRYHRPRTVEALHRAVGGARAPERPVPGGVE
eukprot:7769880-Pyramimonas_sp.AAC.1